MTVTMLRLLRFLQRLFQKLLSFEMPNISHISIFLFPLLYSFDAEVYDVGVKYSTFAMTLSKLSNLDYYKYSMVRYQKCPVRART